MQIEIIQDGQRFGCSLASFIEGNELAADIIEQIAGLAPGEVYEGGGGAGEAWQVVRLDGRPAVKIEGASFEVLELTPADAAGEPCPCGSGDELEAFGLRGLRGSFEACRCCLAEAAGHFLDGGPEVEGAAGEVGW